MSKLAVSLGRVWNWPLSYQTNADQKLTSKRISEIFSAAAAIFAAGYGFREGLSFSTFFLIGMLATVAGHYLGALVSLPVNRIIYGKLREK